MKKIIVSIIVIGLLLTTSIASVNAKTCRPYIYVDDDAPPEWYDETHVKTINEGIEVAEDGDTVYVFNGTYYETVIVDKSITLRGADKDTTTIDGGEGQRYVNVVQIKNSGVSISGFTIRINGGYWNSGDDILIYVFPGCSGNTITGNTIIDNGKYHNYGIYLDSSSGNTITGNTITGESNFGYGIRLYSSSGNTITGNTITEENGIYLNSSSSNTITGNTITGYWGIWLDSSSGNTITGNTITEGNRGIYLDSSRGNTITGNTITNEYFGIHLYFSNDNTIGGTDQQLKNIIKDNNIGICIWDCTYYRGTLQKHNTFDNNTIDIWGGIFGYDQSSTPSNPSSSQQSSLSSQPSTTQQSITAPTTPATLRLPQLLHQLLQLVKAVFS